MPIPELLSIAVEAGAVIGSGFLSALTADHPRHRVQEFGPGSAFGLLFALLHAGTVSSVLLYTVLGSLAYFVAVSVGVRCLKSKPDRIADFETWSIVLAGGVAGALGAFLLAMGLPLLRVEPLSLTDTTRVACAGALAGTVFLLAQDTRAFKRLPGAVQKPVLYIIWQAAVVTVIESAAPRWAEGRPGSLETTLSVLILPVVGLIAAIFQIIEFIVPSERRPRETRIK